MSKKWLAELLAIFISASSITPLYADSSMIDKPGKETVLEVEKAYIRGEYDPFLRQLHTQYERAGKAGLLKPIFEKAKNGAQKPRTVENIQIKESERNQELLEAVSHDLSSQVAKKVDSIVFYKLPRDKQDSLEHLKQMRFHIPESSEGTLENRLSALETEYYVKSLLLDISQERQKNESPDLYKKKIALSFEKIERMLEVSREHNEKNWIDFLESYKDANRLEKAFQTDLEGLKQLARGKVAAKNPVEEKVKQVMIGYLDDPSKNEGRW